MEPVFSEPTAQVLTHDSQPRSLPRPGTSVLLPVLFLLPFLSSNPISLFDKCIWVVLKLGCVSVVIIFRRLS